MIWISILLIVLVAVAALAFKQTSGKQEQSDYPYQKASVLFTPAERSFLGVLKQSVGDKIEIIGKVRVADVISPKKGLSPSARQKAFNKISAKHFDFLLCNKSDMAVLCAVELNDSSHRTPNRAERDDFLLNVCRAADVPLLQIPAKNSYNLNDVKEHLAKYLKKSLPVVASESQKASPTTTQEKRCPKCASSMIRRVAKQGQNAGKEFWACSAYPKCKHIEDKHCKPRILFLHSVLA